MGGRRVLVHGRPRVGGPLFPLFSIFLWELTKAGLLQDSVTYSHAVRRGLNPDSAGIIIARLAGMPERAIKVAQELRERYTQRPVE